MSIRPLLAATGLLLGMACATAGPPPTAAPAPLQPGAHSSLDAVLQYREELNLSEEQVQRLRTLDDQLVKQNATLQAENPVHSAPASVDPGRGAGAGPGAGMGHHRGGGMQTPPLQNAPSQDNLRERLGENDTQAYLQAQPLFTEAQKARADEIASQYRVQLYDWQEFRKQHPVEGQ